MYLSDFWKIREERYKVVRAWSDIHVSSWINTRGSSEGYILATFLNYCGKIPDKSNQRGKGLISSVVEARFHMVGQDWQQEAEVTGLITATDRKQ